jgi:hypothetical protein
LIEQCNSFQDKFTLDSFGTSNLSFKLKNFCVFFVQAQGLGLQGLLFVLTQLYHEETQEQSFIAAKKEVTFQQPIDFFQKICKYSCSFFRSEHT